MHHGSCSYLLSSSVCFQLYTDSYPQPLLAICRLCMWPEVEGVLKVFTQLQVLLHCWNTMQLQVKVLESSELKVQLLTKNFSSFFDEQLSKWMNLTTVIFFERTHSVPTGRSCHSGGVTLVKVFVVVFWDDGRLSLSLSSCFTLFNSCCCCTK